jgi:hypothetical protein
MPRRQSQTYTFAIATTTNQPTTVSIPGSATACGAMPPELLATASCFFLAGAAAFAAFFCPGLAPMAEAGAARSVVPSAWNTCCCWFGHVAAMMTMIVVNVSYTYTHTQQGKKPQHHASVAKTDTCPLPR